MVSGLEARTFTVDEAFERFHHRTQSCRESDRTYVGIEVITDLRKDSDVEPEVDHQQVDRVCEFVPRGFVVGRDHVESEADIDLADELTEHRLQRGVGSQIAHGRERRRDGDRIGDERKHVAGVVCQRQVRVQDIRRESDPVRRNRRDEGVREPAADPCADRNLLECDIR